MIGVQTAQWLVINIDWLGNIVAIVNHQCTGKFSPAGNHAGIGIARSHQAVGHHAPHG